jgi:glyoxylate reductase
VDDATATTAIYLIISAMRQFAKAEVACRAGEWKKNLPLARDPEYKTLGIVGMGGIGTVVARRMALGWGMRIIYHNRKRLTSEPEDFKVEYKASLDELLQEADVVSLHVPVSLSVPCLLTLPDEHED